MPKPIDYYIIWLERWEIPIEATATLRTLQEWLRREINPNISRFDSWWEATRLYYEELAPRGIRPVTRRIPETGDVEMRWAIKGKPGLWGWRSVKELLGW